MIPTLFGLMEFFVRVCTALIGSPIWGETALFFVKTGAWITVAVLLVFGCIWKFKKRIARYFRLSGTIDPDQKQILVKIDER